MLFNNIFGLWNITQDEITALHCAAQTGYLKVVEILVKSGAQLETQKLVSRVILVFLHKQGRHFSVLIGWAYCVAYS